MLKAHLLVLARRDLLQEVGHALARRQPEAQALEEGDDLLARPVVHQHPCSEMQLCSYDMSIRVLVLPKQLLPGCILVSAYLLWLCLRFRADML